MRWLNLALASCMFLPAAWGADPSPHKPIANLPVIKELPNPFLFQDGSPVRDTKDWERRRSELKQLFQDYMYGHLPAKPKIDEGESIVYGESPVTTGL